MHFLTSTGPLIIYNYEDQQREGTQLNYVIYNYITYIHS